MSLTEHVCFALAQAPVQRVNFQPAAGFGVSLTVLPFVNAFAHAFGQEMPFGELVTVPLPATVTVSFVVANTAPEEAAAEVRTATLSTRSHFACIDAILLNLSLRFHYRARSCR